MPAHPGAGLRTSAGVPSAKRWLGVPPSTIDFTPDQRRDHRAPPVPDLFPCTIALYRVPARDAGIPPIRRTGRSSLGTLTWVTMKSPLYWTRLLALITLLTRENCCRSAR